MGFAGGKQQALEFLAALGARKPSEMTAPAEAPPELPEFPDDALLPPEPSSGS